MVAETNIIIVTESDRSPWTVSARRVADVLAESAAGLGASDRVTVSLLSLDALAAGSETATESQSRLCCVICHPVPPLWPFLRAHHSYQWIFVSGGRPSLPDDISRRLGPNRVMLFEGAYGREAHFAAWLQAWHEFGFSADRFGETTDVLLSGVRGPTRHCVSLLMNLTPLKLVVDAYLAACDVSVNASSRHRQPTDRSSLATQLGNVLADLKTNQRAFHLISSDATLVAGMVRSGTLSVGIRRDELSELLEYLVPRSGGHFGDYEPQLDAEMRAIVGQQSPSDAIDEVMMRWHGRIDRLTALLLEIVEIHKASNAQPSRTKEGSE